MQQIDWTWLGITLLWTGGLACILTVLGQVYFLSQTQKQSFLRQLAAPKTLMVLSLGGLFYLAGLLLSSAEVLFKISNLVGIGWLWVETGLAWRKNQPILHK